MFCEKCGKELPEGAKFCEGCGAPVGGAQAKETPKNSFEETVKNLGNTADVTGDFDAADIAKTRYWRCLRISAFSSSSRCWQRRTRSSRVSTRIRGLSSLLRALSGVSSAASSI